MPSAIFQSNRKVLFSKCNKKNLLNQSVPHDRGVNGQKFSKNLAKLLRFKLEWDQAITPQKLIYFQCRSPSRRPLLSFPMISFEAGAFAFRAQYKILFTESSSVVNLDLSAGM